MYIVALGHSFTWQFSLTLHNLDADSVLKQANEKLRNIVYVCVEGEGCSVRVLPQTATDWVDVLERPSVCSVRRHGLRLWSQRVGGSDHFTAHAHVWPVLQNSEPRLNNIHGRVVCRILTLFTHCQLVLAGCFWQWGGDIRAQCKGVNRTGYRTPV
jgi:hypothetical protein